MKVPPHSYESEQSVLWAILIDKDCLLSIWDLLKPEDFYNDVNGIIYDVIMDLYKNNSPIDLITVKEKLENRKLLEKVWWITYLTELTDIVPTSSNANEYAQIVKNKSVLRSLIRAWNEIIAYWYDENWKLSESLEKSEKSLFNVTQTFIKNKLVHINDILASRYDEFAEIHENPDLVTKHRLQVWFNNLDNKLWGLKWWDMVILAARPSMWKTAFALNLAQNIWFDWKNVAIFSLEMSKEQLTDRMIASAMWIDSWKLAKWELDDKEFGKIWDAMERLSSANVYIDDSAWWSLVDLKSKCRRVLLLLNRWSFFLLIYYLWWFIIFFIMKIFFAIT